jgi:hypothetical protein
MNENFDALIDKSLRQLADLEAKRSHHAGRAANLSKP